MSLPSAGEPSCEQQYETGDNFPFPTAFLSQGRKRIMAGVYLLERCLQTLLFEIFTELQQTLIRSDLVQS